MPKENISPEDAIRIALDEENFSLYRTYDLSRIAAFFADLAAKVTLEVNERIRCGRVV